jgi:type IV pilus assembly protein PilC
MNNEGEIVKGQWECNNIKELIEYLHEKKESLLFIDKDKLNFKKITFKQGIKNNELALFCKYFGIMLESGVPLLEITNINSLQFKKGKLYENNMYIAQALRRGEALHEAITNCPYKFPEFFINMVKVGEDSGNLGEVYNNLSTYYYKKSKLSKKLIEVAIYPTFVFVFSIFLAMILLTTVVPSMLDMILSMGGDLPLATKITLAVSFFLTNNFGYIVAFILATMVILKVLTKAGKVNFDFIRRKLPLVKEIFYKSSSYDFLYALYLLYHSGVNIVTSLEGAAQIISDSYIREQVLNSANYIREGSNLAEALMNVEIIDYSSLTMICLGEETGKLSEILSRLLMIIEDELRSKLEKLLQLLQPISILIVGIIVGSIVISILLPMFSLYSL